MSTAPSFKQSPEELRVWSSLGFDEEEAFEWRLLGYGAQEAAEWKHLGFPRIHASRCRNAGMSPGRAREWLDAGISLPSAAQYGWSPTLWDPTIEPKQAVELNRIGIPFVGRVHMEWIALHSLEELVRLANEASRHGYKGACDQGMMETGLAVDQVLDAFAAGFNEYEIRRWNKHLGYSLDAWTTWHSAGFTPEDAELLAPAFDRPVDVLAWSARGFTPEWAAGYRSRHATLDAAIAFREQGFLPEDLDAAGHPCANRPSWSWTDVFSRSRGTKHVYAFRRNPDSVARARVSQALRNLEAPENAVSGGMYSSVGASLAFLDGGVYSYTPYGFGGIHGTWVFGDLALALLCDRAALRRPRGLKAPRPQTLAEAWRSQLDSSRATLEKRASDVLGVQWLSQIDELVSGGSETREAVVDT